MQFAEQYCVFLSWLSMQGLREIGVSYCVHNMHCSVTKGVYRAAEGGERACNSRTSCIEGEMLAVTKFKSRNDAV